MAHPPPPADTGRQAGGPPRFDAAGAFLAATALLGATNLFLGFTDVVDGWYDSSSFSYYDQRGAFAWLPALLFLGGLAAVRALASHHRADRSWPLLFTAAAVVPFLLTLIASDHPTGLATGEILYLVFGLLQLLAAAAAALLGLGRITFTAHPDPAPPPPGADEDA
ncbi:DUF5336 domain-containing protein [Kitasatospora phosalacinea]|uniref:Uncharacterized protein n=1 Tax=Kitasatospora phosalacinea TaxID=2065 RepID=A0A9W6UMA1_9ACTN|nr:DUF5336 domain-containing protein [Kitasatospora phosalacinea]GLW55241.1 hypothetical protein Kpho01_32520 [Kitasatospora phosalacinea]